MYSDLILRGCETFSDLILRSRESGVSKDGATPGLAAILRDARKGALLRMRSEIHSQPLRMRSEIFSGQHRLVSP
jgi:hypothetical protein